MRNVKKAQNAKYICKKITKQTNILKGQDHRCVMRNAKERLPQRNKHKKEPPIDDPVDRGDRRLAQARYA